MASSALRWALFLSLVICGPIWAQISPIQACYKTAPNGPGEGPGAPIPNPNLDFSWSCDGQGQDCIFLPNILNPALKADLKLFEWTWGDTNPPVVWRRYAIQEVRYRYPVLSNTYLVTLKATFHSGQVETIAKQVTITVDPPSAHFGWNNVFWGTHLYIDTAVGDPTTHRYFWDFGDGTTSRNASHKCFCKNYERPGQYAVTLKVVNRSVVPATEVSLTRMVEVTNVAPETTFTATNSHKTFTFDASASRDEPPFDPAASDDWAYNCPPCWAYRTNAGLKFEWDFGDGSFGTGMNATHEFAAAGTHTVRLTATDRNGAIGTFSRTITVPSDPPVAALDFSCMGRTCRFDAGRSKDDGGISSYIFNFGDGSPAVTSTEAVVMKTFASDNYYTVTVTANDGALQSTASRVATVNDQFKSPSLFYFTVEPCRVFDSRQTPPALTHLTTRNISVAGRCQIPYTAKAVALNLTSVAPNSTGYLRAFRPGGPVPLASVLNWTPDRAPRSNNVTVAVANDAIAVQPTLFPAPGVTGTTELLVDVVGFYSEDIVPFAVAKGPFTYESLAAPCRAYDSRSVPGAGLTSSIPTWFKVRGKCGIPPDLGPFGGAVALNLAIIGATADGSVNVYPSNMAAAPNTTTLHFRSAVMNHANAVNAALAQRPNDDIAISYTAPAGATAQYVVDTAGYFSERGTEYFRPLHPCRAVDTRRPERGESRLAANLLQDFQIRGNCGVPSDATAVLVNAHVIQPDGGGNLLLWPAGTTEPLASSVNFTEGENAIANTLIVPLGSGLRDLSARATQHGAHLALDVFGYFSSTYGGMDAPARKEDH